jgi:hypothetical protein
MSKTPEITCGFDGGDSWPYIAADGVHVAEKRKGGKNRVMWVAVAPGWTVIDDDSNPSPWPREIIGPDGPVRLQ